MEKKVKETADKHEQTTIRNMDEIKWDSRRSKKEQSEKDEKVQFRSIDLRSHK